MGSLQPDLLAEYHAVTELAGSAPFARACLRDLTAQHATTALTVLARAAAHRPEATGLITSALRADLPGLGLAAVEVSIQTPGPVAGILAEVGATCDATLKTLIQIDEAIPYQTVVLAKASLTLTARINDMLPEDSNKAALAWWRNRLGGRLEQAGRLADALAATEDAVTIYRDLAAADPARYHPNLARALRSFQPELAGQRGWCGRGWWCSGW